MGTARRPLCDLDHLRAMRQTDPWRVGEAILHEMEDWLCQLACERGLQGGRRGFGTYLEYLKGQHALPGHLESLLQQAKELRDKVSHKAGLAVTPEKVDDLFRLIDDLYRCSATKAQELMTAQPTCIAEDAVLADACALMLQHDYSQLPVLHDDQEITGLLTEKDILRFQAHSAGPWDQVMVGEVLPPEAAQQLVTVVPQTTVDCVRSHLVKPEIPAVLVTPDGTRYHLPLGIITRADLLRLV